MMSVVERVKYCLQIIMKVSNLLMKKKTEMNICCTKYLFSLCMLQ